MKTQIVAFVAGFICGSAALDLTRIVDHKLNIPANYNNGVFDGIIFAAVFLAARRVAIEFIKDEMSKSKINED